MESNPNSEISSAHVERLHQELNKATAAAYTKIGDKKYMTDSRGALVPVENVKTQDALVDEAVRRIMVFAKDISGQIARFKGHCFEDLNGLQSLLEQEYGAKLGGKKGNTTYFSYDGLMKVQVQIAEFITFGPELQVAKKLIDECLLEWGAQSHEAVRALINRVFSVEKEGQINRAELFSLRRLSIADERWQQAMRAIEDSIRVQGSKAYIRFYTRPNLDARWSSITIDIASAGE